MAKAKKKMRHSGAASTGKPAFTEQRPVNRELWEFQRRLKLARALYAASGNQGMLLTFRSRKMPHRRLVSIRDSKGSVRSYTLYPVYVAGDHVYDSGHGYDPADLHEYLDMLDAMNPDLCIDIAFSLGFPWDQSISEWVEAHTFLLDR